MLVSKRLHEYFSALGLIACLSSLAACFEPDLTTTSNSSSASATDPPVTDQDTSPDDMGTEETSTTTTTTTGHTVDTTTDDGTTDTATGDSGPSGPGTTGTDPTDGPNGTTDTTDPTDFLGWPNPFTMRQERLSSGLIFAIRVTSTVGGKILSWGSLPASVFSNTQAQMMLYAGTTEEPTELLATSPVWLLSESQTVDHLSEASVPANATLWLGIEVSQDIDFQRHVPATTRICVKFTDDFNAAPPLAFEADSCADEAPGNLFIEFSPR